ncbi:MAG: ABC-type Mn2+/Zn2+ transport system permease subunit [Porticoccaceae bacterium]|jgi:ABC-type Mn2+/Zn2+ transport system permease subunit
MIEMLSLYTGAIFSGLLCATALALLGCHMASRDQSLQGLVVSQAATVGVLLGVALMIGGHADVSGSPIPLATGVIAATLFYFLGEQLTFGKRSSKTNVYLAVFILLQAISYWLISYFPVLESHMSQAFFGDIVTLSGNTLWFTSLVSVVVLTALLVCWKPITNHSFIISVVGIGQVRNQFYLRLFRVLTLLLISTSIYAMGLLFTIAFLLLPTVIFSFARIPSIRLHLCLVSLTAAVSFAAGFTLSLYFDRISTVPTIVLTNAVLTTVCLGLLALYTAGKQIPNGNPHKRS